MPFSYQTSFPVAFVGNFVIPSSAISAWIFNWVGPTNVAPMFATSLAPRPIERLKHRPPTRSRASSTITDLPDLCSWRAAVRPARPAPTTTTSALCLRLGGWRFCLRFLASAAPGTAAAAPVASVPATNRLRVIRLLSLVIPAAPPVSGVGYVNTESRHALRSVGLNGDRANGCGPRTGASRVTGCGS